MAFAFGGVSVSSYRAARADMYFSVTQEGFVQMSHYVYLLLNVIFFGIAFAFLRLRYKKELKKSFKLVIAGVIFAFVGYFITELPATYWGAWAYYSNSVLGIFIGKSVIETLIWAIVLGAMLGMAVSVFASREEKKKGF